MFKPLKVWQPAGAPSAFGTGPAVGPEVSPSTLAEAEKLMQVELSGGRIGRPFDFSAPYSEEARRDRTCAWRQCPPDLSGKSIREARCRLSRHNRVSLGSEVGSKYARMRPSHPT